MSAIVLGIAALVAINSFGDNLARSIDGQARELLGADLVLSANKELKDTVMNAISATQGFSFNMTSEISLASIAFFPKGQGVRLAQIRSFNGGNYPYYGDWEIEPKLAGSFSRIIFTPQKHPYPYANMR